MSTRPLEPIVVIGAGPAGSAAATHLARAGMPVVLLDRRPVLGPYLDEKPCGGGFLDDARDELRSLGLDDVLTPLAHDTAVVRMHTPRVGQAVVPVPFRMIRRSVLDRHLARGARDAGVRVFEAVDVVDVIARPGGVDVLARDGRTFPGAYAVLCCGARVLPALAANLDGPTAVGGSAFVSLGDALDPGAVHTWLLPRARGYAWAFPHGGGRFNVGLGFFLPEHRPAAAIWEAVNRVFPAFEAVVGRSIGVRNLRWAPLRTGFGGLPAAGPGWLAAGECMGTTLPVIGAGIGTALRCGRVAAEALLQAGPGPAAHASVHAAYARRVRRELGPWQVAYGAAGHLLGAPAALDGVTWGLRLPGPARGAAAFFRGRWSA